jgi:GNAT superfamily N-acetyltransferase
MINHPLVVRDDWQRQHVGTELARRVLQAAEDRGFHRFVAYVLPRNGAIRAILNSIANVVSAVWGGGVLELAFIRRRP